MAYVSLTAARARAREHTPDIRTRFSRAWEVAREAAEFLKTRYSVERVVVFGSLLEETRFSPWSDIDLAVWGLPAKDYFETIAHVLDIGDDIEVDLVRGESCKPALRAEIEAGIAL